MAYDEALAARVRRALGGEPVEEKRMFGGLTFMVRGNMCCGVAGPDLMLRLGEAGGEEALGSAHVRPMDFTGRPMKGFVFVGAQGLATDEQLRGWVRRALDFVDTLPAKKPARKRR